MKHLRATLFFSVLVLSCVSARVAWADSCAEFHGALACCPSGFEAWVIGDGFSCLRPSYSRNCAVVHGALACCHNGLKAYRINGALSCLND